MKSILIISTAAVGLVLLIPMVVGAQRTPSTKPALAQRTYTNPVAENLPDPFVIRANGMYYAYGTNAPGEGYRVLESPDLIDWTDKGFAFQKTDTSWGRENFWAPCVVEKDGSFYLFYSSMGRVPAGHLSHRISVAKASSPLGPFTDIKAPLLDFGKAVIDAQVSLDPDSNKAYLYYALDMSEYTNEHGRKESDLYVVELSPSLMEMVGEPVRCAKPDQPWEGNPKTEDCWNEGPFVFKHKNTWVMMYSAHGFFDPNYSLGYATSKSPMGPFVKAKENPILKKTPKVSGPGHNSVVTSPDGKEIFCVYHIHKKLTGGHERDLSIDRMQIIDEPDGSVRLKITGPTRTPQPAPSGSGLVAPSTQPAMK
ncbi:MAG: family 43 glycosylhydrolase [Anaerolineae bacterium]|nr:family 43 glycosylhydrolase [Phycisphaerae bacterium]